MEDNRLFSYQTVLMDLINSDDNTRGQLFKESIDELAKSIEELGGLINPITLVKQGQEFKLISGKRRLEAMRSLGYSSIEAKVYEELSEQEIFLMNCVENIQREDISLTDEVKIVRFMAETGMDDVSISVKLGKSLYYVRNRKSLGNACRDLWDTYSKGFLTEKQLATLSRFDEVTQIQIAKNIADKISNKQMELILADIEKPLLNINFYHDSTLVPEVGPCSACKFNTAVNSLFSDEDPRCTNSECYNNKTATFYARAFLKIAGEDPLILLIYTKLPHSWSALETEVVKKIQGEHPYHEVLPGEFDIMLGKDKEMPEGYSAAYVIAGENFTKLVYIKKKNEVPAPETTSDQTAEKPTPKPTQMNVDVLSERLRSLRATRDRKIYDVAYNFINEKKYSNLDVPLHSFEFACYLRNLMVFLKFQPANVDFVVSDKMNALHDNRLMEYCKQLLPNDPIVIQMFRHFIMKTMKLNSFVDKDAMNNIAGIHYEDEYMQILNTTMTSLDKKEEELDKKIKKLLGVPTDPIAESVEETTEVKPEVERGEVVDKIDAIIAEITADPVKEVTPNPALEPSPSTGRNWKLPEDKNLSASDIINSIYGEN